MHKITTFLASFTNSLTMYLTTVYALLGIVGMSLVLSTAGVLGFSFFALLGTLSILLASTYCSSRLFAWTFNTQHNRASGLITSLILYLTLAPGDSSIELFKIALVGCLATASKYLLAWRGRHVFNPAALALLAASTLGLAPALWWVATPLLLPVVLVAGLVIVTKTRRYLMVGVFLAVALATSVIVAGANSYPVTEALRLDIMSGPLVFFAAVMLTEPLTSPATRRHQIGYASLTGLLYSAQLPVVSTPHSALLIGNLYAFVTQPWRRALVFYVKTCQQIAPRIYELTLRSGTPLAYTAGQYIELQIPHANQDSRGTRRIFSIASAPGDTTIRLATKLPPTRASSFKRALAQLTPATQLRATYIGGDFVLPHDTDTPLLWIASGIGITPFRAMAEVLATTRTMQQVTLLYHAYTPADLVYLTYFQQIARHTQLTVIPIVAHPNRAWTGARGGLSSKLLASHIPDISRHIVYISGSPTVVESTRDLFGGTYTPKHIRTDYFTGY